MQQEIQSSHETDVNGNPAGGHTTGRGIDIVWQKGPLGRSEDGTRVEPNGAFVEGVILAAMDRLNYYQSSKFKCDENALAILHLKSALHACGQRTKKREEQKVEGTHQVHA